MDKSSSSQATIQTELSRDMGLTTILAIGIGTMIAAGIFSLSGLAIQQVGSAATLSFILAAIVATFSALTYCEFVSIYPNSGEGYLYARKTFAAPLAYFVGWALVVAYTSSCAFYIATFSEYFFDFIWESPIHSLSGLVMLIGLILLNIKGTKESGNFQIIVTLGKVLLLIWFIFGGMAYVDVDALIAKFSTDVADIGSTAALVFITFFGFSAIAATAGEVRDPVRNIPRAIFLSMIIVTVIYVLVIVVMATSGLTEFTEAAMGDAANKFLGPIGGMVIVAGGLFSMVSASNASIMAGSRVTLAMSQFGHFPRAFGAISDRTRTPIVSVMLVGGTIMLFVLSLPLKDLANFANTILFLVLILVNIALILHRRKYPDIERPFKVPLVPLLPALGILANLYLIWQSFSEAWEKDHTAPIIMALATLVLGVLAFFAWKGTQYEETAIEGSPSRVALGRYAPQEGEFRILVPLSNPRNAERLIQLAADIGKERKGEIIALRVMVVPEQAVPSEEDEFLQREQHILDQAHRAAQAHGIAVTSLLRIGHNAARAILETARERQCDLILMGWKGFPTTKQKILGEVTDAVVRNAKTDIMLVKLRDNKPLTRFLLPSAGGAHTRRAGEYVASLIKASGGSLTLGAVAGPNTSASQTEEIKTRLNDTLAELSQKSGAEVRSKILVHESVADGVIEASQDYDAVVVGATGYGYFQQILFGSIPEEIAKGTDRAVILVKHYHPVKSLIEKVMGE